MAHGRTEFPHRSNERRWERHITRIDNKPVGVRRVHCVTPGCGQQGEILDRTENGFVPIVIERRFAAKGWEIGKSEKHDLCPTCVEKRTVERRLARRNLKPELTVVPTQPAQQEQEMPTVAPTPDTASREDKRVIFAKLQDVYLDEAKGYAVPWTDQAVAKDIGCPVAWVAAVREDNFGPARDNQEIRDMLDRVGTYGKEALSILDEARKIRADGAALVERVNTLNHRVVNVERSIAGLQIIADRIGKAVLS